MANIPKVPTGHYLAANVKRGGARSFGPYCSVIVIPGDSVVLTDNAGAKLAKVDLTGKYEVELAQLNPVVLPYVHRFLSGTTTDRVVKNWRSPTGAYRLKSVRSAKRARQSASAVVMPVVPTVEVQPSADIVANVVAEMTQPKAATITIAKTASPSVKVAVTNPIPGMIYASSPRKTKSAARGWTLVNDAIVVDNDDLQTMDDGWDLTQQGERGSVVITGPSGTAKTMFVRNWAEARGFDYLKIDCGAVKSVDDWSIHLVQDPNTKVWERKWAPFAQALRAGKPCVILLDELSRTETSAALNALLGLLDDSGTLLVSESNTVLTMPKGIMVVATANIGPEFVGTLPIDGAVLQRFAYGIRMPYPPEAVESGVLVNRTGISSATADALVRLAAQQRLQRDDADAFPSGMTMSLRHLLAMANLIAKGRETKKAIWAVLKGQFQPGDDKALTTLIDVTFPKITVTPSPAEPTPATIVTGRHWFHGSGANCTYVQPGVYIECGMALSHPVHYGDK